MVKAQARNNDVRMGRSDSSKTVSKEVTDKLLRRIINGDYSPGQKLPTERELAEEFGINRIMVREALKRIEMLGLLTIVHGSGSYVEDINIRGGIELTDLLLMSDDSTWNLKILHDIFEFHEFTVANAVRFAALRISDKELENIESLVAKRGQLLEDEEGLVEVTLELSRAIVEASHNVYIHLLFNSAIRLAEGFRELFELPGHLDLGVQTFFERLIEAFKHKDGELAMVLSNRVFETYKQHFFNELDSMDGNNKEGPAK